MQTELYIYIYNENTYKGLYAILSIVGLFEHWAIDAWPNGYSVVGWENTRPLPACLYHDLRSRYGSTHVQGYVSGQERGNTA